MSDNRMTPIVISPQEYKATQISESKRLAAENELDEGPEGGRYQVGDHRLWTPTATPSRNPRRRKSRPARRGRPEPPARIGPRANHESR
jgi:hypothetical protein